MKKGSAETPEKSITIFPDKNCLSCPHIPYKSYLDLADLEYETEVMVKYAEIISVINLLNPVFCLQRKLNPNW